MTEMEAILMDPEEVVRVHTEYPIGTKLRIEYHTPRIVTVVGYEYNYAGIVVCTEGPQIHTDKRGPYTFTRAVVTKLEYQNA